MKNIKSFKNFINENNKINEQELDFTLTDAVEISTDANKEIPKYSKALKWLGVKSADEAFLKYEQEDSDYYDDWKEITQNIDSYSKKHIKFNNTKVYDGVYLVSWEYEKVAMFYDGFGDFFGYVAQ